MTSRGSKPATGAVGTAETGTPAAGRISSVYRILHTPPQHGAALTRDMTFSGLARTTDTDQRAATHSEPVALTTGVTVYGCAADEAALFRHIAPRLGVVPIITEAAIGVANVDLAVGNRCVIVGHKTPVDKPTLRALSSVGVEYLATRSIGTDHIDVESAASVGMSVGNVAYSPDSVADYTVMLMLMVLRNAATMLRRVDNHDYRLPAGPGRELRDLTVGVVGTGRIGAAVIARLRGFGCRILAFDPCPKADVAYVPLDELLGRSDVVTLHVPLTADTYHVLDGDRLARMKPGAVLINTARGALVDTAAMTAAMERGALGGAALDVLDGEDGIFYTDCRRGVAVPAWLARLHQLRNVVISPHAAYYTERALVDMVEQSLANCLQFEREHRHD